MKIIINFELITAEMIGIEYSLELELKDSRGAKTIKIIQVKMGVPTSTY